MKLSNLSDKQLFLYTFWRKQDALHHAPHPLDIYHEYLKRIDEVNKQFTYQKTPGWKTDMGRVYLTYGPPPQNGVEKHLFESAARPYIYWDYYNLDQNVRLSSGHQAHFVFLDRQGGGKFYLVESNVIGETSERNGYKS